MKKYEFDAMVCKRDNMDATFIEFPYDVEKEFGVKGQVKVKAWFDGIPYRGSLARMGHWCHCLGITREIRKQIAKNPGDTVHIVLEQDLEERVVAVPEDFLRLLGQYPESLSFFEKLSYTHRKEYVRWIESAKKEETRASRIEKAMEMLKQGNKTK